MSLISFKEYLNEDFYGEHAKQFTLTTHGLSNKNIICFFEALSAPINLYKYMRTFESNDTRYVMEKSPSNMYTGIVFVDKKTLFIFITAAKNITHDILCIALDKNPKKQYAVLPNKYLEIYNRTDDSYNKKIRGIWCFPFRFINFKIYSNLSKDVVDNIEDQKKLTQIFKFDDDNYKTLFDYNESDEDCE